MDKKLYIIESPESLETKLNNLPRKPGLFTAEEIVNKYIIQINNAIDYGYSYKEIANIFNETGCKISANALKITYEKLTNSKPTRKKRSSSNLPIVNNGVNNEQPTE